MSSEDPFADSSGAFTVTLKYGKGYEEPWLVIRGRSAAEAKARVADAVGLEGADDLTLAEVIVNAKSVVQGASNVAAKLGGTAIPKSESKPSEPAAPAPAEESQGPSLAERIEAVGTKQQGQHLYLNNRTAIDADADLKAKMMDKMKSL